MSTTSSDLELVSSLFDDVDLPVVYFKRVPDTDVLYTNEKYRSEFSDSDVVAGERKLSENGVELHYHQDVDFTVELLSVDGWKKYQCRRLGFGRGAVDIYIDITTYSKKKEYVDVLHRLLRHNLRNETNVILGHACMALEDLEEGTKAYESVNKVVERVEHLRGLSDETQIIRGVIDNPRPLKAVDLNKHITRVVSSYDSQYPDVDFSLNLSSDCIVWANNRLEHLVTSLVDNSIRHNSLPVSVNIDTSTTTDTIRFRIWDDGVGIPELEQKVATGDITVDSLSHGSGLGFWAVKWISDRIGASVSFPGEHSDSDILIEFQRPPE